MGKLSFFFSKFFAVDRAAARKSAVGADDAVQRLVKEHILEKVVGYLRIIEQTVDADLLAALVIKTVADAPLGRRGKPDDGKVQFARKVRLVDQIPLAS